MKDLKEQAISAAIEMIEQAFEVTPNQKNLDKILDTFLSQYIKDNNLISKDSKVDENGV